MVLSVHLFIKAIYVTRTPSSRLKAPDVMYTLYSYNAIVLQEFYFCMKCLFDLDDLPIYTKIKIFKMR